MWMKKTLEIVHTDGPRKQSCYVYGDSRWGLVPHDTEPRMWHPTHLPSCKMLGPDAFKARQAKQFIELLTERLGPAKYDHSSDELTELETICREIRQDVS